jgi:hypothetical protein
MADAGRRSPGTLAIFGVAVLLNLILTVLLVQQVRENREEVREFARTLATKQDVAMLNPLRVRQILEENCLACHTDRRWAETWGMEENELLATIQRMRSHPGGEHIAGADVRRIESAILVLRCTSCHDEAVLSRLRLMPRPERVRFLREKIAMPGSGFRPDQIGELIEAFRVLAGERS